MDPSLEGLILFDEPILGYAYAHDALFDRFCNEWDICHGRFRHPTWWLDSAQTVISIFMPYAEEILKSNMIDKVSPSMEWLHARYEGQQRISDLTSHLIGALESMGHSAMAPLLDSRFYHVDTRSPSIEANASNSSFGSNWSERHVAFVAGLGTFGLSKGLITKKGVAGRFTSVITSMPHTPTTRGYEGIYEYCNMCGACIERCPVGAISLECGKEHLPCSLFLDAILEQSSPRYGCGKCQVGLPCSRCAPGLL